MIISIHLFFSFKKRFWVRWVVARVHHSDSSLPESSCSNSMIKNKSFNVEMWANCSLFCQALNTPFWRKWCRLLELLAVASVCSQAKDDHTPSGFKVDLTLWNIPAWGALLELSGPSAHQALGRVGHSAIPFWHSAATKARWQWDSAPQLLKLMWAFCCCGYVEVTFSSYRVVAWVCLTTFLGFVRIMPTFQEMQT